MNKKIIIEGNKLIAESPFGNCDLLNEKVFRYRHWGVDWNNQRASQDWAAEGLKYHSSWDWLMPVIEKIEHCEDTNDRGYSFHVCIFDKDCHIYEDVNDEDPPVITQEAETKIIATWKAVIEFIKFKNSQE